MEHEKMSDKPDSTITRSMVGLTYVYKDEVCGRCKGAGSLSSEAFAGLAFTCQDCHGSGFRTFKVELSQAIKELKRTGAL